jgi:predicted HTH transcriptional regulator
MKLEGAETDEAMLEVKAEQSESAGEQSDPNPEKPYRNILEDEQNLILHFRKEYGKNSNQSLQDVEDIQSKIVDKLNSIQKLSKSQDLYILDSKGRSVRVICSVPDCPFVIKLRQNDDG